MSLFKLFSYLTVVAVYMLIVIGGYVTSTGSGQACPDWPLCHGQIIPPLSTPVLIEFTHRLWTVLVTVFVVSTGVLAWVGTKKHPLSLFLATINVLLLLAQVLLGMVTVQLASHPLIVTLHLAFATALFALVVANAIFSSRTVL